MKGGESHVKFRWYSVCRLHTVNTAKANRGSPSNLAIKVTGREVKGKRAMLKKETVTLSVGKWCDDDLKGVQADLGLTDGGSDSEGVMSHTQRHSPFKVASFML